MQQASGCMWPTAPTWTALRSMQTPPPYRKLARPRRTDNSIALALDGPDNFLYVLDNLANQIEVFSIDTSSGALTLINGSPFALFAGASNQSLGPNAMAVQH